MSELLLLQPRLCRTSTLFYAGRGNDRPSSKKSQSEAFREIRHLFYTYGPSSIDETTENRLAMRPIPVGL